MGRAEAGNSEEAAQPWPSRVGRPQGCPCPSSPWPSLPPPLLPQECGPGWGTLGSQLRPRVLATLALREEGEMEGGRRSWPGQWGRDRSPHHVRGASVVWLAAFLISPLPPSHFSHAGPLVTQACSCPRAFALLFFVSCALVFFCFCVLNIFIMKNFRHKSRENSIMI